MVEPSINEKGADGMFAMTYEEAQAYVPVRDYTVAAATVVEELPLIASGERVPCSAGRLPEPRAEFRHIGEKPRTWKRWRRHQRGGW